MRNQPQVFAFVNQMFQQLPDDEKLTCSPTLFIMSFTIAHPCYYKPQSIDRALRKCKSAYRIQLASQKDYWTNNNT